MNQEYLFDTGSDLGRRQVDHLENLVDRPTKLFLGDTDIQPGQRCLELGAGGGSIARWMAERTGPGGEVVAVDLKVDYLDPHPGVEIRCHDVNDGLPADGGFDVIHARLLLLHLPRRQEILRELVDALRPGGWLVIGDYSDRPLQVRSAPGKEADEDLFHRVLDLSHNVVGPAHGMDFTWARRVDGLMHEAGLTNIEGMEYAPTTAGGSDGGLLTHNTNVQAESQLLQAGAEKADLERFRELMLDPEFRFWHYQLIYSRGQKPTV